MSRAKLWEDTIIIALRDMQWLAKIKSIAASEDLSTIITKMKSDDYVVPPGLAKLDGRAESKIGDVVTKFKDDKFFIFEVKSTSAHIGSEWRGEKSSKSKLAYGRLKNKVDEVNNAYSKKADEESNKNRDKKDDLSDSNIPDNEIILLSLKGHYFAYWEAKSRGRIAKGQVVLEPYILAASRHRNGIEMTDESLLGSLSQQYFLVDSRRKLRNCLPINDVDSMRIVRIPARIDSFSEDYPDTSNNVIRSEQVGLNKDELEKYLKFLCADESGGILNDSQESIHMVILSKYGFMKVITDTNDLLWFIDGKIRQEPKDRLVIDRDYSNRPDHPQV